MAHIAIIGAGPAGLMAAEHLAAKFPTESGHTITVYDRMPSPARKFLLAGRGGLNLTHSEPFPGFLARYREAAPWLAAAIEAFPPDALRAWAHGLGQPTFIGSSGRIFPESFKAAPLLRAWLRRLDGLGVTFAGRHSWLGWSAGATQAATGLHFTTPAGTAVVHADATLLALGGASWPRMGADGAWVPILRAAGVAVRELRAANCGVHIAWSDHLRARQAGAPLKRFALSVGGETMRGEAVITETGLEGGALYALTAPLRAALDASGHATLYVDLCPDQTAAALAARVDTPRGGRSLTKFLTERASLSPAAAALVNEALHAGQKADPPSRLLKALPLTVTGLQPIARAISSAGGIAHTELTEDFMLRAHPGLFAAGEMLDWEAPTGGYLLQACFATGLAAAHGMQYWLTRQN